MKEKMTRELYHKITYATPRRLCLTTHDLYDIRICVCTGIIGSIEKNQGKTVQEDWKGARHAINCWQVLAAMNDDEEYYAYCINQPILHRFFSE